MARPLRIKFPGAWYHQIKAVKKAIEELTD